MSLRLQVQLLCKYFSVFPQIRAKQESGNPYDRQYKEPVDGKFEDATDSILQRLKEPEDSGDDTDPNSDLDLDSYGTFIVSNYSNIRN